MPLSLPGCQYVAKSWQVLAEHGSREMSGRCLAGKSGYACVLILHSALHLFHSNTPSISKSYKPYKSRRLDHEGKFDSFMDWVNTSDTVDIQNAELPDLDPPFAVQLGRQVNFGPLESKKYFIPTNDSDGPFKEITESDLIQANFQKLNA